MMRKFLLTTVSILAIGGSAMAADLPQRSYAPPPPIVPIFTWTGFYVGVNAGYGFSDNNSDSRFFDNGIDDDFDDFFDDGDDDNGGFVGGGQIGYNYQFGQFVLGIETDLQYADFGRGNRDDFFDDDNGDFDGRFRGDDDFEWFGTVRGRLGLAFDRALLYGTGGFAYSDNGEGYTFGGGLEYAFTNNLTAKIEGLYVSLDRGGNDDVFFDDFDDDFIDDNRGDNEFFVVRAGLNYKFW